MIQIAIADRLFAKLQRAAHQRNIDVSVFLETLVDEYFADDQYREETDPAIGFVYGPTDLSTQAKTILQEEVTEYSGCRGRAT